MSRVRMILLAIGGVIALLAITALTGVWVVRSDWFREKVRERIVAEAEKATNGRVEIGAFQFDWSTLTAQLDNLTVHGTEAAGQAPLLTVKRLRLGLKIVSLLERAFDIASVEADAPKAHLIIQADGDINIPPPHKFRPQMLLDLKVKTFALRDGMILAEAPGSKPREIPWHANGGNLAAQVHYDPKKARYDGDVTLSPLHFEWDGFGAVDVQITARAGMEKNLITVSHASVKSAESELDVSDVKVSGFTAPVTTANYKGKVGLGEIDRIFKLVNFRHSGTVNVAGDARFVSMSDYLVSGNVQGTGVTYGSVTHLNASGKFLVDPDTIQLTGLRLTAPVGSIDARGEVRNLKTFQLAGQMARFDIHDLTVLAGMRALPYDGVVSGPFRARGMLSERDFHDIVVSATATIAPAATGLPVHGQATATYEGTNNKVTFGASSIELPETHAEFSGVPGETLEVTLQSKDLNELRPAISIPPALQSGAIAFKGTITGPLNDPRIAGHTAITDAVFDGRKIESLAGDFTAAKSSLTVRNTSLHASGQQARINGSIGLSDWTVPNNAPLNGDIQVSNGNLADLLALADRKNVPLSGTLETKAQISGTAGDPHITADFTLGKGQVYGEPYDSFTGRAQYLNGGAQTLTAVLNAGAKRANLTARFENASPGTGPLSGKLTFNVASNSFELNQLATLRQREPDIRGTGQIKADGVFQLRQDASGRMHVAVLDLNGDFLGAALALGSRNFGDAHLTASTKNDVLTAKLVSNAASAVIHGDGTIRLAGDYPISAKVTFSDVKLNAIEAMLRPAAPEQKEGFDGLMAGEVNLQGPVRTPDLITATAEISRFELAPSPVAGSTLNLERLVVRNSGPIRMTAAGSVLKFETAHFQGPETNLDLNGSVALNNQSPLDLQIRGNINLALAHTFSEDLTSSGQMAVNATIRGSWDKPEFSGRAELKNGEFHYADFLSSLTNANGVLLFNGTRATIQTFTAESGGGKVDATGFATLTSGLITFRLEARSHEVRIRYPEGVSSVSDADLTLAGTSERSEASGKITVRRIAINPKSDAASILSHWLEPIQTPAVRTGLVANLNLDIQIETAPDVVFETSVARSLQADASLRLRGTATNPALLGRINVTQGEMVFFGNKYTINQGSISFFNPAKIDPILNFDLETKSRGVDVILTASGPIARLNVSYRSDPPLQFGDIVALLATGRTPTNATLAATYTGQAQSFQQLGASAVIGQALTSPAPGRLQRFFGVSKIKVDPQLMGITGSPEARLTIEQQVTPDILFTYVSDVASTSTQLIRVQFDINRHWGAILTREENGYVGLDFAYKKRFK